MSKLRRVETSKSSFCEYCECLLRSLLIIRTCRTMLRNLGTRNHVRDAINSFTWAGTKRTNSVKSCTSRRMKERRGEGRERGGDETGPFVRCIRSGCESTFAFVPSARATTRFGVSLCTAAAPQCDALSPHLSHSPRWRSPIWADVRFRSFLKNVSAFIWERLC